MIGTVTLNPAVDKTYETGRVILGDVNRMRSAVNVAGGKGINVAKLLRQFHLNVAALGFLGGYTGRMIEDTCMKLGVECHFTRIKGETRSSINILGDDGYVTEILEPGPMITEKEYRNFLQEFEYCAEHCEIMVLSGSAPGGIPGNIYAQLIEICRFYSKRVILDTSGELLREGIKASPYLIKPNKKELEYLTGRKLSGQEEIVSAARELVEGGIQKAVVSLGAEGLLYVDAGQVISKPAKKVKVVNTVGCGDSVVAALCMSELAGEDPEMMMQKAAALSAAHATTGENGNLPIQTYMDLL